MAYTDPQRGRDAVRAWRKANPELVRQQRKTAIIRRALKEQRLPSLCTISRHGLNDEDLRCIVDAVMCGQGMPLVASIPLPARARLQPYAHRPCPRGAPR